jgi:mRNA interferase MazF
MKKLKFGEIVLLKFPYSDSKNFKRRPALVLKDSNDGDIIVCRITSKLYNTKYDFKMPDWEKCGLKLPSVIRLHKIATLEKNMIELIMGKINKSLSTNIKNELSEIFK